MLKTHRYGYYNMYTHYLALQDIGGAAYKDMLPRDPIYPLLLVPKSSFLCNNGAVKLFETPERLTAFFDSVDSLIHDKSTIFDADFLESCFFYEVHS